MKVWFTKGLSNTLDAVSLIKNDPSGSGIAILGSHVDPHHPLQAVCTEFLVEPAQINGAEYAGWVHETALRRNVDLIVVQRKRRSLWSERARFTSAGMKLQLPAAPEVLDLLDNKLAFQRDLDLPELAAAGVFGHVALPFADLAEFDAARELLQTQVDARYGLCVKPTVGTFGSGFRRIELDGKDFERMMSPDPEDLFRISLDGFRLALARAGRPREMLLMPYLPGPERSIDFVSRDGELIVAVARVKSVKHQVLEVAGPAIEIARRLARRYGLNGLCNLQTREIDGRQVILEINARMSGGMSMACLAGVNLPLLSILSEAGLPFPRPVNLRDGTVVAMVETARVIAAAQVEFQAFPPEHDPQRIISCCFGAA